MKKLIKGIINFRKNSLETYRTKFSKLALQQSPDVLFVACCDSRVVPNVFASSDPGDLFVLRNIGNLIPPYHIHTKDAHLIDASVSATIEFSLLNLKIQHIIICGHSNCGAMRTLMKNDSKMAQTEPSLNTWLEYAASSYKRFKNCNLKNTNITPCNLLSKINVIQQLDNLKTYPLVMERLQNNTLQIHGWWFDLTTANIYHFDQKTELFLLLEDEETATRIILR